MTGLLLIAGGGLAREVIAQERVLGRFDELLVLDDDASRWGRDVAGVRVAGGLDLAREHPDHELLVCCGKGTTRAAVVARLESVGVTGDRYATSVHPMASVAPGCRVGAGSILLSGTTLTADVTVGRHVVCMPHVVLTHDDVVADFATLCAGTVLGGSVEIGTAAYLGMRSSVREGVHVGPGAVLGMGSVLLRDLPADETWAGVPARRLEARPASPSTRTVVGPPTTRSTSPSVGLRGPVEGRA